MVKVHIYRLAAASKRGYGQDGWRATFMDKSVVTRISNLAQDGVPSAWYDCRRELEAP